MGNREWDIKSEKWGVGSGGMGNRKWEIVV